MAFSTTQTSEGERLPAEINVTPLIDILLVLLIIFMVIVPVVPSGLNASVPSTTSTGRTDEGADRPILVQMEQDQTMVRYRVDGTPLEESEVKFHLRDLFSKRSVKQVLLQADARLDFGAVAAMIGTSRAAGADNVGLLIEEASDRTRQVKRRRVDR